MKGLGVGCIGAVLGLVVGAILVFALQILGSSAAPPVIVPTPSASQSDVTITVGAAFINSQLQQAVRQSGFGKQASMTLASPNLFRVAMVVDASTFGVPITVNAAVSMHVLVQGGRIVLTVDKVDAGGVAVPQMVIGPEIEKMRAQAEDEINRLVQRALQGSNLRVSSVRVTPNDLTVDLVSQ